MPSSILKSVARVGSRATEVAKQAAPFITLPGSRRTSWMAFEQPNPSKIMAPPVISPPPPSPPRGDGGDRPEKPPNASSIADRLAKQQAFLEWFIFAAESELRRRTLAQRRRTQQQQRQQQKQRPYYELPTTRLCIPDHPATFGCAPAARLDPRLETRVGERPAPVRVWKYDYEVERAVTDLARAKAERERVKAKQQRLRVMYREALQETMRHD